MVTYRTGHAGPSRRERAAATAMSLAILSLSLLLPPLLPPRTSATPPESRSLATFIVPPEVSVIAALAVDAPTIPAPAASTGGSAGPSPKPATAAGGSTTRSTPSSPIERTPAIVPIAAPFLLPTTAEAAGVGIADPPVGGGGGSGAGSGSGTGDGAGGGEALARAVWLRKPTPYELRSNWPASALQFGISGRVMLTCRIAPTGRPSSCTVTNEAPSGQGFGRAAMTMVPLFRIRPVTRDGVWTDQPVFVPVEFEHVRRPPGRDLRG